MKARRITRQKSRFIFPTKVLICKKTKDKSNCWLTWYIWATSWENLFMPHANNKGTDQPAHPHKLISAFVVCCLDSIIHLIFKSEISRLQLVSVAEQASLSLTWSKTGFLVTWLILASHCIRPLGNSVQMTLDGLDVDHFEPLVVLDFLKIHS